MRNWHKLHDKWPKSKWETIKKKLSEKLPKTEWETSEKQSEKLQKKQSEKLPKSEWETVKIWVRNCRKLNQRLLYCTTETFLLGPEQYIVPIVTNTQLIVWCHIALMTNLRVQAWPGQPPHQDSLELIRCVWECHAPRDGSAGLAQLWRSTTPKREPPATE